MQKSGHMVLKGVNWVLIDKMKKSGYIVLKGDNWVHNTKVRSYRLERSQFGTKCKNQVKWS